MKIPSEIGQNYLKTTNNQKPWVKTCGESWISWGKSSERIKKRGPEVLLWVTEREAIADPTPWHGVVSWGYLQLSSSH